MSGRTVGDIDSELEAVEAARQRAELARDAAGQRLNRLRDEVMGAQRAAMTAQQRALEAAAAVSKVNELQNKVRRGRRGGREGREVVGEEEGLRRSKMMEEGRWRWRRRRWELSEECL